MSAILEIDESLIRSHITRAVADVFETMLSRTVELCQDPHERVADTCEAVGKVQVVGTVGFVGDFSGLIYLHFDLEFARLCTCHLLGITVAELEEAGDEAINDAIGELTNVTVGSFKNRLCDSNFHCRFTVPSILRGARFSVEPLRSAQRHTYRFRCAGTYVVADIMMKSGD
jgi:chemotaxis protein CheX